MIMKVGMRTSPSLQERRWRKGSGAGMELGWRRMEGRRCSKNTAGRGIGIRCARGDRRQVERKGSRHQQATQKGSAETRDRRQGKGPGRRRCAAEEMARPVPVHGKLQGDGPLSIHPGRLVEMNGEPNGTYGDRVKGLTGGGDLQLSAGLVARPAILQ